MVIKLFSQNVRGGSHKVTFIKNINYIYMKPISTKVEVH